jgi:Family of unknown function (DUF6714)
MNKELLLQEIEETFPLVEKPEGLDISFHKDDCAHCFYLRKDLAEYKGKTLPNEGIRVIHDEMSSLSTKGWRWALPSFLKYSINVTDHSDDRETEFLIYNLSPSQEYEKETTERLSELNESQITCLIHFLEWCQDHPFWSDYCEEDISRGIKFLKKQV